ncbi:MAG: hypothetical protein R6W69_09660, partial [Anaerolineales bacterium]
PDQSMSGTVEAWGRLNAGPNGEPAFRVEVLTADEADLIGTIAVSDGGQFWLWNPAQNVVLTGQFEELYARIAAEMAGQEFDHNGDFDYDFDEADVPQTPEEALTSVLSTRAISDCSHPTGKVIRLLPLQVRYKTD